MAHDTRVLIAIQARSTSRRFPNKAAAMIGERSMTECVLDSVRDSVDFMQRNMRDPVQFHIALLIPFSDPLKRFSNQVDIIEGEENNVLSRFQKAFTFYRPDFTCRITADCPMIPEYVISKHIRSAIFGPFDYATNSDPRFSTCIDGHDCEVMSKRMMRWLFDNAKTKGHLEHVTLLAKENPPAWARICNIIGYQDLSNMKLSVDTPEDLERVRLQHAKLQAKIEDAKTYRSNSVVFRL